MESAKQRKKTTNNIENETISLIIVTKDREKDIIHCLKSISMQTRLPGEVIIIDSSEKKGLEDKVKKFKYLNLTYFHTEKVGIPVQRNIGIGKSKGDVIFFCDDDTMLTKNFLEELLKVFKLYPNDIGGVTAHWLRKKQSIPKQILEVCVWLFCSVFFHGRIASGKFRSSGLPDVISDEKHGIRKCEFLYGFAMAFKRETIKEFMFDENLRGYANGEDQDIAYRISRKYQNYYTPSAKIYHNMSSTAREQTFRAAERKVRYLSYRFKKNMPQDLWHKFAFWWAVFGMFILEVLLGIKNVSFKGPFGVIKAVLDIVRKKPLI